MSGAELLEENYEWEEWDPSKMSFVNHMIAGSIAGLAEHVSLFPVDTIKTHIQCEKCGSISPFKTWNCATRIISNEGVFRLWRGVSAMFAGCIPAHAAYFSVYETAKLHLGADKEGHHPIMAAATGALAALSHDMFMTPFDMIKQRMQLGYYKNIVDCIKNVGRTEGILSFYVSLPTTLMMNIPYGCIMVAVNESARKFINPSGSYSFSTFLAAGSIAGAVASCLTTPLDVIKTRLQTQNLEPFSKSSSLKNSNFAFSANLVHHGPIDKSKNLGFNILFRSIFNSTKPSAEGNSKYSGSNRVLQGTFQIIRKIALEEGFNGFFRGVVPRMVAQAPSVAISWTAYESVKGFLLSRS